MQATRKYLINRKQFNIFMHGKYFIKVVEKKVSYKVYISCNCNPKAIFQLFTSPVTTVNFH